MLKKVLAGVTTTAVLAVGGVAVAGAVSSPAKTTKPTAPAAKRGRESAVALTALALQSAAQTIGVDVKTLRSDMRSGETIAAVATQHHVAPATVVHGIVTKLDRAVDSAVSSHRIDAAQAAKIKPRIPALADRLVNHAHVAKRKGTGQQFHSRRTLTAAASAIGISETLLRQDMHAGQTIAAIARAHGVSPNKVVAAMVAAADRNFDATAARTRRANRRYRNSIPKIMQNFVNGT